MDKISTPRSLRLLNSYTGSTFSTIYLLVFFTGILGPPSERKTPKGEIHYPPGVPVTPGEEVLHESVTDKVRPHRALEDVGRECRPTGSEHRCLSTQLFKLHLKCVYSL